MIVIKYIVINYNMTVTNSDKVLEFLKNGPIINNRIKNINSSTFRN